MHDVNVSGFPTMNTQGNQQKNRSIYKARLKRCTAEKETSCDGKTNA